jgi:AcrR family transcriptional regulator
VIEAARSLFLERGYGATTIDAISDHADVPPATVYRLFSSKLGILKSLLDVSIVGDDEKVPMADRPQVRSLLADRDPAQHLAGFVSVTAQVNARVAPLYRILVSAPGTDPA